VWVKAGQDKRPEGIAGGDKSARRSGVTVEAVHTERAEILRCTRLPTRAVRGDWTTTTPRRPCHTRVETKRAHNRRVRVARLQMAPNVSAEDRALCQEWKQKEHNHEP